MLVNVFPTTPTQNQDASMKDNIISILREEVKEELTNQGLKGFVIKTNLLLLYKDAWWLAYIAFHPNMPLLNEATSDSVYNSIETNDPPYTSLFSAHSYSCSVRANRHVE